MKVIFIGNYEKSGEISAPTIVAKSIFHNFSKLNHSSIYICYFQDGSKYNRFQKLFGKELVEDNVYRCGIFPLIGLVIKYKADIIHLSTLEMFYVVLFPLKYIIKAKFIYTVHGLASYEYKYFVTKTRFLKLRAILNEWLVILNTDYIFALSERISRFIRRYFKIKKDRIILFKNGITIYPDIMKKYSEQIRTVKIISVGSIDRGEKGYSYLTESLAKLKYPIELTLISANNNGKSIFRNLPNNINLTIKGPLDNKDLRMEMAGNDFYIASSKYETFSISLLESMNAGTLFISTNRVGLTDYFPNNFRQFIVNYGNKEHLVNKLTELIELSAADKNKISSEINKFSLSFEWERVITELENKYYQILK